MHYPWHARQWQQVMNMHTSNRLPHAVLLTGLEGVGKRHFADSLIRTLLCESTHKKNNFYCNNCHSCRLIAGQAHPNVLWLEPEKEGAAIKVDQIRAANEFAAQSSLQGVKRFVVINPADNMNLNAANALLKTLEEPANDAVIILVNHSAGTLPPTILSRCQRIDFSIPDKELALAWLCDQGEVENSELLLRLANGAPLHALRLSENNALKQRSSLYNALCSNKLDPIKMAPEYKDLDLLVFIDYMQTWMMDLIKLHLGQHHPELMNMDYTRQLLELKEQTNLENSQKFLLYLQDLRKQFCNGINLNKILAIESILIRWLDGLKVPECI